MDKDYYAQKGLVVGITAIICAFYFFAPTLFTFKSALIKQSGAVTAVKTFYFPVESSRGGKSIKSELKFTLSSHKQVYVLMKNIGQARYNERFEQLATDLRITGKASVWIKESQKKDFKPTVFQIADGNHRVLYDFEESKSRSQLGFLICTGVGICGIGLYLRHQFQKKAASNKG